MRKLRRPTAYAAALLLATALSVGSLTPAPAAAHSSWEAEASVENFEALRWCESGDDYALDTGNGYYGAYQFSPWTWWDLGYEGYPHEAPPGVQDDAAWLLQSLYGWGQWPGCASWLGLW
jgi:resuscitation-promoting factor RpfA